jgi:hypothetical protein
MGKIFIYTHIILLNVFKIILNRIFFQLEVLIAKDRVPNNCPFYLVLFLLPLFLKKAGSLLPDPSGTGQALSHRTPDFGVSSVERYAPSPTLRVRGKLSRLAW